MTIKKKEGAKGTKNKSEGYIKKAKYCFEQTESVELLRGIGFSLLAVTVELRDLREELVETRKKEEERRDALLKKLGEIIDSKP